MKRYWVDGDERSAGDLVYRAIDYGYSGRDGTFLASEAAVVLRENGYSVEETDEPTLTPSE